MSCHRRNPTTVTFPGGRASADWHPPVLSPLQIPLKRVRWNKHGRLLRHPLTLTKTSSSLVLFSNHGRNRLWALRTKAGVCFFAGLLFQACSSVCVCWTLMCNAATLAFATPLTEWTLAKVCREQGRREDYKGEEKCFLSFSITNKLFFFAETNVLPRSLSFSTALIWAPCNQLMWQWTFQLVHTERSWCGPLLSLAPTC